ncbi:MAG: hypothetical protein M1823_000079 [Watsoniomyces obsoletus]|nr:MAG: hypothetical protein M1823_000079 [Watsoniomyces obsoletus]
MNPTNSTRASTTASSDVRPRNRRPPVPSRRGTLLHSSDEEESELHSPSPFPSPRPSRTASPIARQHASLDSGGTRQPRWAANGRPDHRYASRGSYQTTSAFTSGLWEGSWSAIQGMASTMLKGDVNGSGSGTSKTHSPPRSRLRGPSAPTSGSRWFNSGSEPLQWGPEPHRRGEDLIAAGSRESREALIRAIRRDGLLAANEHVIPDAIGNYKRRVSDDRGIVSSIPESASRMDQQDGDVEELVYLHHVQPQDTVAGVIIQFHCQPAIFRKANRLWPNDPIQCRKTVVLPVHACAVKGKPVSAPSGNGERDDRHLEQQPSEVDLLDDSIPAWSPSPDMFRDRKNQSSITSFDTQEDPPPWTHDSWVTIDGHPAPVEIVRMPRRKLGYFPPARRKSRSSEDHNNNDSAPMSLDLPRPMGGRSVGGGGYSDRSKSRSNSNSNSNSTTNFLAHRLHGIGGVGMLGAGTKSPGPAQDGLNKYLAPHLPNVAPRDSFESVGSSSNFSTTGLEVVGSAIEGWMKRVASRAAAAIAENSGGAAAAVVGRCRASLEGDLIELEDGMSDEGAGPSLSRNAAIAGSGIDADMERALRERYPMRGRSVAETTTENARKKGD